MTILASSSWFENGTGIKIGIFWQFVKENVGVWQQNIFLGRSRRFHQFLQKLNQFLHWQPPSFSHKKNIINRCQPFVIFVLPHKWRGWFCRHFIYCLIFSLQCWFIFRVFSLESLYQRYCMVDELMCDRYIIIMCKCVDETVSLNYGVGLQFSMMQMS